MMSRVSYPFIRELLRKRGLNSCSDMKNCHSSKKMNQSIQLRMAYPHFIRKEYLRNFRHFLDCSQIDPETLVKQARDSPRLVESLIINHIRHLAEKQN